MSKQGPPLILVVDDRAEDLRDVVARLRAERFRVSHATGGRQGFYRAQALVPDLILLDVIMPDMDGFAMCRLLQASPRTRDIPIVFLTSAPADDEQLQGLDHSGVDYMIKPCLVVEILARVRSHLRLALLRSGVAGPDSLDAVLSPDEVILRAAMRLISGNLVSLPGLDELARRVGTYDKKLSMIFRKYLGTTVFAWAREERLRRSREWLACSQMSIQDIATQAGFRSAANFATAFRKRMGVTPSVYRRNLQTAGVTNKDSSVR